MGFVDPCVDPLRRREISKWKAEIVTSDFWFCHALSESPQRPGYKPGVDCMHDITTYHFALSA